MRKILTVASLFIAIASAAAAAPKTQSWESLLKEAVSLSAQQNRGFPVTSRSCQQELGLCSVSVQYRNYNNGNLIMMRAAIDNANRITVRDVCTFTADQKHRSCVNYDSGVTISDDITNDGKWITSQQ